MKLRDGLREVLSISHAGNKYLQDSQPWKLFKEDLPRCSTVIHMSVNLAYLLALTIEPFLPTIAADTLEQLNVSKTLLPEKFEFAIPEGHAMGVPKKLVTRLEEKQIKALQLRFSGKSTADILEVDARVGKIIEVNDHPKADALYLLKVDVGEENPRQVVAGLKKRYEASALLSKSVIVVCNLKPANFRGSKSQGMLLAADDGENLGLLVPKVDKPGTLVTADSCERKPKEKMDFKKDFAKIALKLDDNSEAVFVTDDGNSRKLQIEGFPVQADGLVRPGAKIR